MKETSKLRQAISCADAGYTIIKLGVNSKKAVQKAWQKQAYRFGEEVEADLKTWSGNYGVVLGVQDLVIDYDPRNAKKGDHPLKRLLNDAKINLREGTAWVRTGGADKGVHIYMGLPKGLKIKENQDAYKGVEFKTKGRYLVGPGCIHPDTGRIYDNHHGKFDNVAEAPESLLGIIAQKASVGRPITRDVPIGEGEKDNAGEILERYISYLESAPPAVQGDSGDKTTFAVACQGRDFGLSETKTLELMIDHYNPRCEPEWGEDELARKVQNAFTYASGKTGQALPEADFKKVKAPSVKYERNENGKMKKWPSNVGKLFADDTKPFFNILKYNKFEDDYLISKPLPWHNPKHETFNVGGESWARRDTIALRQWLELKEHQSFPIPLIAEGLEMAVLDRTYHPIKEYLTNLKWDGRDRLETWLIDLAGAKDTAYTRAVSKMMLMQAVKRIYVPGCQADYVVVFEGDQGIGKTRLVKALGGEFYGEIHIDPKDKDTVAGLKGKWFLEMAEMVVTRKIDAQSLKAFISRTVDDVRPVYAPKPVKTKRQCVFVGTENPDATGEYFADSSGNRRFLPVPLKQVDVDGAQAMRDQLFAEATNRMLLGEPSYITDPKVMKYVVREQKKRQSTDPYLDPIADWVAAQSEKETFTSQELWSLALDGSTSHVNAYHARRIAICMQELGYEKQIRKIKGRTVRRFEPEGYDHKVKK